MNNGFSLLELLIVLILIGILSVAAFSSYQHITLKARRLDAQTTLLNYHTQLQKCFMTEHNYTTCIQQFNLEASQNSLENFYKIQAIQIEITDYTLQALAQGTQQQDESCYRFTLDHFLQRLAYDQNGNTQPHCWY
ncbi:MAG: type IV pilin protein [Gammaproteobacteria bacterium]